MTINLRQSPSPALDLRAVRPCFMFCVSFFIFHFSFFILHSSFFILHPIVIYPFAVFECSEWLVILWPVMLWLSTSILEQMLPRTYLQLYHAACPAHVNEEKINNVLAMLSKKKKTPLSTSPALALSAPLCVSIQPDRRDPSS
jgi:hypothetical protein